MNLGLYGFYLRDLLFCALIPSKSVFLGVDLLNKSAQHHCKHFRNPSNYKNCTLIAGPQMSIRMSQHSSRHGFKGENLGRKMKS
jgi:hypothetical protein